MKFCGTVLGAFRIPIYKFVFTVICYFACNLFIAVGATTGDMLWYCIRRGADKSLARPTSRCRRTESRVSLERGVCSCAELQVFKG